MIPFSFNRITDANGDPYIVNTGVFAAQNPDSWLARRGESTITHEKDPDCQEKTVCEKSLSEEVCDCRQFAKLNPDLINSNQTIWKNSQIFFSVSTFFQV